MTRRVNAETIDAIRRFEGFRAHAYRDAAGIWTIGYGHTAGVRAGQVITEAEGAALLREDLAEAESAVERLISVPLTDNQFGALVSFTFNVGAGALERSTLRRRLNAGEYEAVPAELAKWNRAGGRVLPGLVNRRAAEAGLWARGSHVSTNTVEATPPPGPVAENAAPLTAGGVAGAAAAAPLVAAFAGIPWQTAAVMVAAALVAGLAFLVLRSLQRRRAAI